MLSTCEVLAHGVSKKGGKSAQKRTRVEDSFKSRPNRFLQVETTRFVYWKVVTGYDIDTAFTLFSKKSNEMPPAAMPRITTMKEEKIVRFKRESKTEAVSTTLWLAASPEFNMTDFAVTTFGDCDCDEIEFNKP